RGLDGFRIKIKNEFANTTQEAFDVIILGDSYFVSGVIPQLIEEKAHLRAFNFATYSAHGIFGSYCLFKNYLENSSHVPKYLVLAFQVETISLSKIAPEYMYDLKLNNAMQLMEEFGWAEGVKFQVPSLKHQYFYREVLQNFKIPSFLNSKEIESFIHGVIADRGRYAPHENEMLAESAREEDVNFKYRFRVSPSSKSNLDKILNLARKNHIQIFYVVPTLSQDWYSLYSKLGVIEGYERFLSSLQKEFPEIHLLRFQDQIQDIALYSDRLHLNRNGAYDLTSLIASKLR
ncbi:MAG: DUF1574 domain-containing protein, partial [Candidatus Omnitrophica bacterium]|nr:DUF1574 domain-containing protein [Candidatus Omnitrophota bacterium]